MFFCVVCFVCPSVSVLALLQSGFSSPEPFGSGIGAHVRIVLHGLPVWDGGMGWALTACSPGGLVPSFPPLGALSVSIPSSSFFLRFLHFALVIILIFYFVSSYSLFCVSFILLGLRFVLFLVFFLVI